MNSLVEGSLEVKLPKIWTDEKQRWEESERREESKREDQRRERVRRKKMQMREKVGKSRNTLFSQSFVAPESRKVGSLKRRVRSHLARWQMTNCMPLWREAHFEVKMYKIHQVRTTFGSVGNKQRTYREINGASVGYVLAVRWASLFSALTVAGVSGGRDELCHLPRTKATRSNPHIPVAMPVLVLSRSEFGSQSRTADTGCLVDLNTVLQKSPCAVNDLCSSLAPHRSLLPRNFVAN